MLTNKDKKQNRKATSFELSAGDVITRVIKSYTTTINGIETEIPVAYAEIPAPDGTIDTRPIHFMNSEEIHLYDENGKPLHKGKLASIRISFGVRNNYQGICYVETIDNKEYLSQYILKHPELSNKQQDTTQTITPYSYLDYILAMKLNSKRFTYKIGTIVNYGSEGEHLLLAPFSVETALTVCNVPDMYYKRLTKYFKTIGEEIKNSYDLDKQTDTNHQ